MTDSDDIIDALAEPYGLAADSYCEPLGLGLINHTLLVYSDTRRLVAQRINRAVFPQPQQVVANALLIERHLAANADYPLAVTRHLADDQGRYLHGPDEDIRVMAQLSQGVSLQQDPSPAQAEAAAAAFGQFAKALVDLNPGQLATVIPDFHNLHWRLQQFDSALKADRLQRAGHCRCEIEFVQSQQALLQEWRQAVTQLPLRVCHNDTKLNNLLVHRDSGQPLAVIDLDTCMAGHLMTDFGDLVRSCTSPVAEDSTRLDLVEARPQLIEALARGYLHGLGQLADACERRSLALGARLVPFLQGLRFLTDYLDGDRYYGSKHPQHNLQRAQNQLALYRSLCARQDWLQQLMEQQVC